MRQTRRLVLVALLAVPAAGWAQGGIPLGAEFRVNTYTTQRQYNASVARSAAGSFTVIWASDGQDGDDFGIFGQRYGPGGDPHGPEFRVNTYTTGRQFLAAVAADPAGNFEVVWQSEGQDGSVTGVFGQRFASTGAPLGGEFRVNTYTTSYQHSPNVASDSAGNFIVAWTSKNQDGSGSGAFAQRYAASGAPLGGEFRVNTFTTFAQILDDVTFDASGKFLILWQDSGYNANYDVYGQRYAASGVPLGSAFRVNSFTTNSQVGGNSAFDAAGNFVVVWSSAIQDGIQWGVFGQRYSAAGAPVGPEFRINTYTSWIEIGGGVASDAAGNFVVVWTSGGQYEGTYAFGGVYGQRYAASGAPVGPEFRINTYTTNNQEGASVAADGVGDFVVAWTSHGQDGSSYGVYAQRYGAIVPVELTHFHVE